MIRDRIEDLILDYDEGGWYLAVSAEKREYAFRLTLPAMRSLWAGAQALGAYLDEADDVAAAVARARRYYDERDAAEAAYALRDPHHPRHHEVFADLADREEAP